MVNLENIIKKFTGRTNARNTILKATIILPMILYANNRDPKPAIYTRVTFQSSTEDVYMMDIESDGKLDIFFRGDRKTGTVMEYYGYMGDMDKNIPEYKGKITKEQQKIYERAVAGDYEGAVILDGRHPILRAL